MELALDLTILVAVVAVGSALARRLSVPAPLLLIVVGVVGLVATNRRRHELADSEDETT